ncbi:MAG: hypothetical protein M3121_05350, partial [Chloroflexota bacterium]|nr:hypothetical protein [Chloroflexota bacterium]
MNEEDRPRQVTLPMSPSFSLALTCGPVAWVGHRSPRHAWCDGTLTWIGWEREHVVWRQATVGKGEKLDISSSTDDRDAHAEWARTVLGIDVVLPAFTDPVIDSLAQRFNGLHPYCDGLLFDGIVTAIVGQSISIAAAAVTQGRLASLFNPPARIAGREFRPLPRADQLANASPELVRTTGVTRRRGQGLVHAARMQQDGVLPTDDAARLNSEEVSGTLQELPLVGRWTAESALLWGVGAPDAYPTGDVALLRAARQVYRNPTLTMRELDRLAEGWRPARGLAARLLWTALFGSVLPPLADATYPNSST